MIFTTYYQRVGGRVSSSKSLLRTIISLPQARLVQTIKRLRHDLITLLTSSEGREGFLFRLFLISISSAHLAFGSYNLCQLRCYSIYKDLITLLISSGWAGGILSPTFFLLQLSANHQLNSPYDNDYHLITTYYQGMGGRVSYSD